MNNLKLVEIMDKRSSRKHSVKEQDSYRERFNILDEKYTRIKEILKQVLTDLRELKAENQKLTAEQEKLSAEIKEKDDLLERMQSVSEAVIDEYTALKLKCELEADAANKAIKRATKYFEENQKLKRNTGQESESDFAGEDTNEILKPESQDDGCISEIDVLNNLASELRTELANLKIQLDKEIEKQNSLKEDFEIAKALYEQEMKDHNCTKEKLQSLQIIQSNSSFNNVNSEDVHHLNSYQLNEIKETDSTKHCSEKDDQTDDIAVIMENSEYQVEFYKHENDKLLCKIQEMESQIQKLTKEVSASDFLPIPPPPPPPPLPPPSFNPIKSLITFIHAGKKSSKTVKKESSENLQQKAMSEMIDAIKKGNIQLKPTRKAALTSPKNEVEETALGEMKNILASLKKKNNSCEDAKPAKLQNIHQKSSTDFPGKETDENFNIGSDIDDELKFLLRKQSIKITSNEDGEFNIDSLPTDGGEEIRKHLEIQIQDVPVTNESQLTCDVFSDSSHKYTDNEKNLVFSVQEPVTSNDYVFSDSALSDKSEMSFESEKNLNVSFQESTLHHKNRYASPFYSNDSTMKTRNETSFVNPSLEPSAGNQLPEENFYDDTKKDAENEECLKVSSQESAAENGRILKNSLSESNTETQLAYHNFTDSRKNCEQKKSKTNLLEKAATENVASNYVFSDYGQIDGKNEESLDTLLQKSSNENPDAEISPVMRNMNPENDKSLEIMLPESTTENQLAGHVFIDNGKKFAESEKNLEITFLESVTENQYPYQDFPDCTRKSTVKEKNLKIQFKESATENQPNDVFSDNNSKSSEKEQSLEIHFQDPVTDKQLTEHDFSDSNRKSAEDEKSQEIQLEESATTN